MMKNITYIYTYYLEFFYEATAWLIKLVVVYLGIRDKGLLGRSGKVKGARHISQDQYGGALGLASADHVV